MATVTNTITLTSNDLTSDAISLSVTNTLSATKGGISRIPLATTAIAGATKLGIAAQFTEGAKVIEGVLNLQHKGGQNKALAVWQAIDVSNIDFLTIFRMFT